MSHPKAQWLTPLAAMKNKEEVYQMLERKSWKPVDLKLDKELNYFNNELEYESKQQYDLHFAYTKTFPLWDIRKNKDNKLYLPDIRENIFEQEKDKPVPVLSSMNYGRPCRTFYDKLDSCFKRKTAIDGFYRRKFPIIPPVEDELLPE